MKPSLLRMVLFGSAYLVAVSCAPPAKPDEHPASAGLADLKIYPGLKVELFASEPDLTNPTNIEVDPRGRVWVCEAYNYRSSLNPKNPTRKEGDRILILEDTNGDGKADKRTVFYQGTDVNAALGICLYGNKIIVSCSPNVLVFTDEDGDDRPDKKEILFRGIQGEQHDHGIHAFTPGPDGFLYFNMGNEGKSLVGADGDTVIDVSGHKVVTNGKPWREGLVLRCKPDGSEVEVVGSNFRNNYEVTVDPYGTLWQSDNDDDGNKGTRINYVMEYGNFGYRDEMTGASWPERRTNMEKEIPLRHWHLNDPGVVPNLLQTGSGSPTGITMYEGTLLPEIFQGQMIHAEAGHNVVRAYPVKDSGAGYSATIVNIAEGQKDQWFRPSDVAVAPDGSLFIADWYDPGVGGHQAGDLDHGRIYRVAPETSSYFVKAAVVSYPAYAAKALINPNPATRALAIKAFDDFEVTGQSELLTIWNSPNPRHRALAFWQLAKIPGKADKYLLEGIADKDPNIRITALRAARVLKRNLFAYAEKLAGDPSPQVLREAALSLHESKDPGAPQLWASLAMKYDGKDRWYLEALGIGAQGNEEACFRAWKQKAGEKWNSPAGRDIVWRSRSKDALPLLMSLIRAADDSSALRYFRALDFQSDPSRQTLLTQLALQTTGEKQYYALKHLDASATKPTPQLTAALNNVLDQKKGTLEFVDLIAAYKIKDRSAELFSMSQQQPDSFTGQEALKVLLRWNETALPEDVIAKHDKEHVRALVIALSAQVYDKKAMTLMETIFNDTNQNIENRKMAVRAFGGPWETEDRLLALAKENKIPKELHVAAAGVFQNAWRPDLRAAASKYLTLPESKAGTPLPPVSELVAKTGDVAKGKLVFNSNCTTCHRIGSEGVNFGPDLSEIGAKLSKDALYTSILYPDQGIGFGYEGYRFKLKNGTEAFGMIASETAEKIELKYMATHQTLNKADVVSRTKLDVSLMPSTMASLMDADEMVDLVEYLKALK